MFYATFSLHFPAIGTSIITVLEKIQEYTQIILLGFYVEMS
jgi:hypothetical protein